MFNDLQISNKRKESYIKIINITERTGSRVRKPERYGRARPTKFLNYRYNKKKNTILNKYLIQN